MGFLIRELLSGGLLHEDVMTVAGAGLSRYGEEPRLIEGALAWRPAPSASGDEDVLRPLARPFSSNGGLKLIQGNLGRAVIKISAVKQEHRRLAAPALTFDSQQEVIEAYRRGELNRDFIAVLRYQGPRANGMPELHKLTPLLSNLQEEGWKVAMITDGRMSGASGKVPAVVHMTPETLAGGLIGKLRDGDMLELDCEAGTLSARVALAELELRPASNADLSANETGCGRELFGLFRRNAGSAEEGASPILD
jgi:phosphogluconate dehydratase